MSNNRKKNTVPIKQSGSRLTIGFVTGHLKYINSCTVWQGVTDVAREREVNVITFLARDLDTSADFNAQGNALYDLVNPDMLDGLVVWVTRLTEYAGSARAGQVLDRYRSIPIVTVERGGPEDIPWVDADNYQAMRQMMTHLIQEHGYRRIAFVRGPDETHAGARARYQGYLDGLAEFGLPVDPDLMSPPTEGVWWAEAGKKAVALWLDQRQVNVDVIIGANDDMAVEAMQSLQGRGIHVPSQVAVVGFDDGDTCETIIPPLTSIPLQGYEMGRQAAEILLTRLEGGQAPAQTHVPPRLAIRQSCGCANPAVVQAAAELPAGRTQPGDSAQEGQLAPFETALTAQRADILVTLSQAAGSKTAALDPDWTEQLFDAFLTDLSADRSGIFLTALDEVLRRVVNAGGQVAAWENVILVLRRVALPHLGQSQDLWRAENLWLQAEVKIGETAQIVQRRQIIQAKEQAEILDEIRTALITTFDVDDLMDTLAQQLPRLDIPSCYLSLYQNPQHPAEMSRLALAYDESRGRFAPEDGKEIFPSPWLAPQGLLPQDRPYSMVIEPLYFREQQLGFVLFEVGPPDGPIYDALRGEISSALQGALLVQRVQEHSAEITRQQYILDTFMETIPDKIYFKDLESRIRRTNRAHAIGFGLNDAAEIIGKNDFDFFPEEQARSKYDQEQEIIRTGQPLLGLEEPDGEKWTLTTKMPLRDEHGQIIGTFGISRDITDLKQAQMALETAFAEVEQQVQERTAELQRETAERERLQQEVIETQRQALQELSTPIIPVMDRIIVMPLIGSIDTMRAKDITRVLLKGIGDYKAAIVILDITGVPIVDSGVANYLNNTIQAARLKGAQTIVTGMSDAVAEAVVDLGIDWSGIQTLSNLQTGLRVALAKTGQRIVR